MMALAMLMFSVMGVLVKIASASVPTVEAVLFRAVVSGVVVTIWAKREKVSLLGQRTGLLFVRGLAGAAALFLLFFALEDLSVGSALLLNQTTPLFVLPLAALFLGEGVTRRHVLLAFLAVGGVAMVVKPSAAMPLVPSLMALSSAVFAAVAYVLVRYLSATEHPLTIVFWFNLISSVAAVPAALPFFVVPSIETLVVLIALALLATFGQVLMTVAYRHGEAGRIAVVGSTGALFGAGLDYLIWSHLPGVLTAIGGLLVIVSCSAMQLLSARDKERGETPCTRPFRRG